MSFSYDFVANPQVAYVRLLIADTSVAQPIFQDEEINAGYAIQNSTFQSSQFFSPPGGNTLPIGPVSYLRVAALMLDAVASNKARLASIKQLLDVKMDSSDAAIQLRAQAAEYRSVDDNSGAIMIIEQCSTDWAVRDRFFKQVARQSFPAIPAGA